MSRSFSLGSVLFVFFSFFSVLAFAQSDLAAEQERLREARFKDLWQSADAFHTAGDYASAEARYKAVLDEFPDSQRTALRIAITQERQKKIERSLASYDRAIEMDPFADWAAVALFFKARACKENGHRLQAENACKRFMALHPDSPYVGRIRLLEAEMTSGDLQSAQYELERELTAAEQYDAAMGKSRAGVDADADALAELEQVAQTWPDTGAALRSLEAQGHILTRNEQHEQALSKFRQILSRTATKYPESRIAQVTTTRVAALLHVLEEREEALSVYSSLLRPELSDATVQNAQLQSAGLIFEILQRRPDAPESVSASEWNSLRELLQSIQSDETTTAHAQVRAALMDLETYYWEGRYEDTIEKGNELLMIYSLDENPVEVATMHYFVGGSHYRGEDYAAANAHFDIIVEEFADKDTIWPGMGHLKIVYFKRWDCRRKLGASPEELLQLARELVAKFPDSSHAEVLMLETPQWRDELEHVREESLSASE